MEFGIIIRKIMRCFLKEKIASSVFVFKMSQNSWQRMIEME